MAREWKVRVRLEPGGEVVVRHATAETVWGALEAVEP